MLILVYITIETMRISFYVFRLCIKPLIRKLMLFVNVFIVVVVNFVDILLPKKVGWQKSNPSIKINRLCDKDLLLTLLNLNIERLRLANRDSASVIEGTSLLASDSTILFSYKDQNIKRALWNAKYYKKECFVDFFASVWSDELIAFASDRVSLSNFSLDSKSYIVHPPSSSYTRGEKSFDQMNLMVEKMMSDYSLDNFYIYLRSFVVHNDLVGGMNKAQHKGTRLQRFEWSRDRYKVSIEHFGQHKFLSGNEKLAPNSIICLDDILTTGSTMQSVKKAISDHFPETRVYFSAIAH